MPLPRTPKSGKKKNTPKKPEVPEVKTGSGFDANKDKVVPEVTPVKKQLEEQRRKQKVREMEEKLTALIQQRKAVEDKLRRAQSAIVTRAGVPNPNLRSVNFLKTYLETVKGCYSEYNGFQNEIYALPLSQEQKVEHEGKYQEFEMLYHVLVIELSDLLDAASKPVANAALVPVPPVNAAVPNYLPPLSVPLPKFDGSYETWYSFKSMFQNIMARYVNEAPAIKLYHLRDALVGKAAGVIDQEMVNNNDYDAAWAILEELYEDKRAIIDRHINNLFAMPDITSDNAAELWNAIDVCVKNVEALKALSLPVNGLGEQMLVNLLATRMDNDTRKAWETTQKTGVLPTYEETIAFLKEKRRVAEALERNRQTEKVKPQCSVINTKALVVVSNVKGEVWNQDQMMKKSVNERYGHLRKHGLCFNCLERGHRAGECTSTSSCQSCSKRHHTLLHKDGVRRPEMTTTGAKNSTKPNYEQCCQPGQGQSSAATKTSTLLSTAVVQVYGGDGVSHQCRALIDSCSENHFVTERFANQLAAKKEIANYQVSGLNGGTTRISHLVRAKVKSRVGDFETDLELLVAPKITGDVPVKTIDISGWNLPADVELADPNFHQRRVLGPIEGG